MSEFFKMVYEVVALILYTIINGISSIFKALGDMLIFSWKDYWAVFARYSYDFGPVQWIFAVIFGLIIVGIPICLILFILYRIRHYWGIRKSRFQNRDLVLEINALNHQVEDLISEKNKIMAMKVSQLGLSPQDDPEGGMEDIERVNPDRILDSQPEAATVGAGISAGDAALGAAAASAINSVISDEGAVKVELVENEEEEKNEGARFPKLALVDKSLAAREIPQYDDDITLEEFVYKYRMYAAGKLGLYYNEETIRMFLACMASSRIIILEGVSGTGKTSLPYSLSRFLNNPASIISVQPSFRDRTELFGYFNEFSKKFNETEFLRAVYEAGGMEEPSLVVLDEMNLARIEYYFAEVLSVLEMPSRDEWTVDLVPIAWDNDPERIENGKLTMPGTLWFVGTANNDDSTFTITDKVYDRAGVVELNKRADPFEADDVGPVYIRAEHLEEMFAKAIEENPISETTMTKLNKLDTYLQTRFKLAFGNRITKQMASYVPVYVACGGTEMGALDFFIARKILKKFESMNVTYVRDEIRDLISFIEKTFGKTNLGECKDYLRRIQNMF